jgi:hypothetical protein
MELLVCLGKRAFKRWNEIRNNSNRCYRNDNWTTKKKQKKYYSGKKRRHTLKTQIVADKKTKIIICTAFSTGKTHDFNLFKISKLPINRNIKANLDSGYQGIYNFHKNSKIPKKKTKLHPLTKEDKANNHKVSKQRSVSLCFFIYNLLNKLYYYWRTFFLLMRIYYKHERIL